MWDSIAKKIPNLKTYNGMVLKLLIGMRAGGIILNVNVHLPQEKASVREKSIVNIVENTANIKANYTLLAIAYYFYLAEVLKNPYPAKYPEIKNYMLFETKISEGTNLAASDHYGIIIEMGFFEKPGKPCEFLV